MSQPLQANILVVDDETSVVETFARMLELNGYKVHTALDGEAGLRQVEVHHPDAILLDLRMPILDGLGFLRRLRQSENHRPRTPVAVLTGDYIFERSVDAELQKLCASIYFKPVWLEDLVGIAERLLESQP